MNPWGLKLNNVDYSDKLMRNSYVTTDIDIDSDIDAFLIR